MQGRSVKSVCARESDGSALSIAYLGNRRVQVKTPSITVLCPDSLAELQKVQGLGVVLVVNAPCSHRARVPLLHCISHGADQRWVERHADKRQEAARAKALSHHLAAGVPLLDLVPANSRALHEKTEALGES